jgi:hypothetical protein
MTALRKEMEVQGVHSSAWKALPPVVIVCLSIRHGGVDVRIVQTARKLQQEGCSLVVVVIDGTGLHRTLSDMGLPVVALQRGRLDPRLVLDLVRVIRRTKAGLIDAHNGQSQNWAALAAWLTRLRGRVATVHSIYREDHAARWRQRMHEVPLRLCKRLGFRFLTVSSNVQNYLQGEFGVAPSRLQLSRNGMDDLIELPVPFDRGRRQAGQKTPCFWLSSAALIRARVIGSCWTPWQGSVVPASARRAS